MSQGPAERRGIRIGDAERDAAVDTLREHLIAGRLTLEEFDERMARAVAARTSADLDPLFADLPRNPDAVAGASVWRAPKPPARGRGNPLHIIQRWMIAVIPLVAVLWVLGVAHVWAIVIIGIVIFALLGRAERMLEGSDQRRRQQERRERRQLG